jgi:hypothetical protein
MKRTTHRASKVELRRASNTERNYLYKIFRAAMTEYITQTRGEWSEEREETQFQQQLDISYSQIIRVDGSDIGFIMAPIQDGAAWIHTIRENIAYIPYNIRFHFIARIL